MSKASSSRVLLGAFALVLAGTAQAHHSYADFDGCNRVSVRGEIASLQWVNPHVLVTVRDSAQVEHIVVWFSLTQAAQAGVEGGTLRIGDSVVVTGAPHRDPEKHLLSRISAVQRPVDGWEWTRASGPTTRCAEAAAAGTSPQ